MANLKRIQQRIDLIPALLEEVAALKPLPSAITRGSQLESAYSSADIETLNEHLITWKAQTSEIVAQEVGSTDRNLLLFNKRWRNSLRDINYKAELTRKLQNARSDLRIILQEAKERELAEDPELTQPQDNVWTLMHPTIENATKQHIQDLNYHAALKAAIAVLNRENQHTPANKSLSSTNELQILSGLTTMIQTLATEESISREETLRYLLIISMMIYKVEGVVNYQIDKQKNNNIYEHFQG